MTMTVTRTSSNKMSLNDILFMCLVVPIFGC